MTVPCSDARPAGLLTQFNRQLSSRTAVFTPCPSTSVNLQARTHFQTIIQAHLTECEQISKFCTTLGSMKSIEVAIHA
jgi:hypothetical protein